MKKKTEVCNGHMTVAREGGGGGKGRKGRRKGGARQARHSGPARPAIIGSSGPPF